MLLSSARKMLQRLCAALVLCGLGATSRIAIAQHEQSLEVVWLETASSEIDQRVEGQLSDTHWRLATQVAEFGQTRLPLAFRVAHQRGARAVAWLEDRGVLLELYILDVRRSRLSRREVPAAQDPSQQSATLETVALITRATLQSIEAGAEVGDAVEEPAAPTATPPPEPVRHEEQAPPSDSGAAGWARASVSTAYNLGSVFAGAALGGGAQLDALRIGASLRASLPQHGALSLSDGTQSDLELWRAGIAVATEYDIALSRDWSAYFGGSGSLGLLHRSLERSNSVQPSPSRIHLIPSIGALLGLELSLSPRHTWLELSLGLDYLLRVPHFRLGPAPGEPAPLQLQRLEPSAALGLRFR